MKTIFVCHALLKLLVHFGHFIWLFPLQSALPKSWNLSVTSLVVNQSSDSLNKGNLLRDKPYLYNRVDGQMSSFYVFDWVSNLRRANQEWTLDMGHLIRVILMISLARQRLTQNLFWSSQCKQKQDRYGRVSRLL